MRIKPNRVRVWFKRDVIPPSQFDAIIRAAKKCGFDDITLPVLMKMKPGASQETTNG